MGNTRYAYTPANSIVRYRRIITLPRVAGLLTGCALIASFAAMAKPPQAPLHTVQHVDLNRYMGDWRVIANIPYFAEKGCYDSIESYALRSDGRINNWFTYRKNSFDAPQKTITALAHVKNKTTNAEWNVRFFGVISTAYLVLDLDPNYQWTVVGHPSRNYGWIMARTKTMPDSTYRAILKRLEAQGYDPSRFKKVPQSPPHTKGVIQKGT